MDRPGIQVACVTEFRPGFGRDILFIEEAFKASRLTIGIFARKRRCHPTGSPFRTMGSVPAITSGPIPIDGPVAMAFDPA
jgi:hypothetical protein